jgi:hypothetical protein
MDEWRAVLMSVDELRIHGEVLLWSGNGMRFLADGEYAC